jgi:hypothetical protein
MLAPRHRCTISVVSSIANHAPRYWKRSLPFRQYHRCRRLTTASGDIEINNDDDGRIFWLHRPFQYTPPLASSISMHSGDTHIIVSGCPLPKISQRPETVDRSHHRFSSSSAPERFLVDVQLSKAVFYESQFRSRVTRED